MGYMDKKISMEELKERVELHDRLSNGYKHKNGIMVQAIFNENGDDITKCWAEYLLQKLSE